MKNQWYKKGFTLIEVMAVVVIIGILASLSVAGFYNWQQGLAQRQVQSDLRQASVAMEDARNFGSGYPTSIPATFKASTGVTVTYVGGNATAYCLQGVSTAFSSIIYSIDSTIGKEPVSGACGSAYVLSAPSPTILGITSNSMTVSWPSVVGATSYQVRYGTSSPTTVASCLSSPCTLSGLASSTTYQVTVTAVSAYRTATSAPISGTTISFTVKSMQTGGSAGCAVSSIDIAFCWGYNSRGQLGDGTTTNATRPVAVDTSGVLAGKTIKSFALGSSLTCAIASDNQAYCWGGGSLNFGSLGNGTTAGSTTPVAVDTSGVLAGKTIKSIYAGGESACVIASDNNMYCWGENATGKIGNGTNAHSSSPVAVSTSGVLAGKTIISASMGSAHTCAIASDNQAYCWGANANGQLGNGTTTSSTLPVAVSTSGVLAGKTIKAIAAAASSTCAIASDNLAYCWGYNSSGQLGNGTNTNSSVPVAVSTSGVLAGKTIKAISISSAACAIASDNQAYCWGYGLQSGLGNGANNNSNVPVAVSTSGVLSGKTITSLSAGSNCVIASDNKIYCWGYGANGALGNGASGDSNVPVAVLDP